MHLSNDKDITDDLSERQLQELTDLMTEPAEKDTISEEEFNRLLVRWDSRSLE